MSEREKLEALMLNAMSENHSGNAQEALRIIDDILAALEAAGVRLVPVEATEEMLGSGDAWATGDTILDAHDSAAKIWRSMLAASPYAKE